VTGDGEVLRLQRTTESTKIPTGDLGGTLLRFFVETRAILWVLTTLERD